MNKKRKNIIQICTIFAVSLIITYVLIILLSSAGITKITTYRQVTKSHINSIVVAIKQYESAYGLLPWTGGLGPDMAFSDRNISEYDTLFEILTCVDGPDQNRDVQGNFRGTIFLEVRSHFLEEGYVDSWGNKFKIFIDTNYDGNVTIDDKKLNGHVFAYSYGPNSKDDKGQEDDICSWE